MNTMTKPRILAILIMLVAVSGIGAQRPAPVYADHRSAGDAISAGLIGQVSNPTPALSFQYGYLNYVKGLDPATLAAGSEINERTAFLTFYSHTMTQRVTNNGPMRVIDRVGQLGIYFDTAPNGDFGRLPTFQDGEQVLGAEQHHQVVIDTLTGAFTANFDLTIVWSKRFSLKGADYQLGGPGEHFAMTVFGHLNQQPPPAAHIAGVVRGLEVRK